jgi:hypothetical protein
VNGKDEKTYGNSMETEENIWKIYGKDRETYGTFYGKYRKTYGKFYGKYKKTYIWKIYAKYRNTYMELKVDGSTRKPKYP